MRAPRKIYAIDHGLLQSIRFMFNEDYGRIMENIVYIALRRRVENVYYYKGERACDFLLTKKGRVTHVIQVARTLKDTLTKKRELAGLIEAATHFKLKEGIIVTEDEQEQFVHEGFKIQIMPLWYWLLL